MIEDGRPCLEIAQQLHAVEKAVGQAKKTLVHDHIDHCLDHAVGTNHRKGRGSVEDFKAISKYL
jgi:DNA-binding FrmR family transcriptional regulator